MAHLKIKSRQVTWLLLTMAIGSGWLPVPAQAVYSCTNGTISFFSEAPLEDIEAKSGSLHSMFNAATGEVVFIIPLRTFRFSKALMQEHFNERYLETHKYPQAVYKGKINEKVDLDTDGEYVITAKGTLNLHNVEQPRTDTAKLVVAGDTVYLQAKLKVVLAHHDIEIPRLVFQNIAEVIDVSFKAGYTPYKPR